MGQYFTMQVRAIEPGPTGADVLALIEESLTQQTEVSGTSCWGWRATATFLAEEPYTARTYALNALAAAEKATEIVTAKIWVGTDAGRMFSTAYDIRED